MPITNQENPINPNPAHFVDRDIWRDPNIELAALTVANNGHVFLGNGPTYGWLVNAYNPDVQADIHTMKSGEHGERGIDQPLGLTVPFSWVAGLFDLSYIKNPQMRELLADPNELTRLYGALGFIGVRANMEQKRLRGVPNSVIPDAPNAKVQPYSPNGNDATFKIVRAAMALGALPAMTSVNKSKTPEAINAAMAHDLAQSFDPPVLTVVDMPDELKQIRPRGSYPIIEAKADHFEITRLGCFDPEITASLFDGYPIDVAPEDTLRRPTHVEGVFTSEDLAALKGPYREMINLKGAELRAGLLAVFGWHSDSWQLREDALLDVNNN